MEKIDWACIVDRRNFEDFLIEKLGLDVIETEKRLGMKYGTYFLAKTENEVFYFGNYGLLKAENKNGFLVLEDDFEYLENNQLFMFQYAAFMNNANINGRLLKDIWNEVSFAGFMYCG